MFVKKRTACTIAIAVGTAMVGATAVPANAAAPPKLKVVRTITTNVVAPLNFAVSGSHVFVADGSTLSEVGVSTPIATNPGDNHDIAGVAVDPKTKAIAYTSSTAVGEEGIHTAAALTILRAGHAPQVVDLFKFEKSHNPDRIIHYGVVGKVSACVKKAVEGASGGPAQYTGVVDPHPYAVASLGGGSWAVADAGGNDVLRVEPNGNVFTLGVLPPQPLKITAAFAKASGLPKCVVGITYRSEPVPTGVKVGPKGKLYVSILAGGIAPSGGVYSLDSNAYNTPQLVASGIPTATSLAVDHAGDVFVASLATGTVFEVVAGSSKPVPVLALPNVVGLDFANKHLYASTSPAAASEGNGPPPGPGSIVLLGQA